MRIWRIAEALRRSIPYEDIHGRTRIDPWFIDKIAVLVEMEEVLRKEPLTEELLREAKRLEFPDAVIASLAGKSEEAIRGLRREYGITASYKMVDTCAAEFAAATPYYYSVYGGENEAERHDDRKKVLVLGSSVSARESSLTSAPCTVPGPLPERAMRRSSSIIILRRSAPISILPISCISSR